MPIVVTTLLVAGIVWGLLSIRHISIAIGCVFVVIGGYIVGHELWNAQVGPLPITIDRLLLLVLLVVAAMHWRGNLWHATRPVGADWLVGLLLVVASLSLALAGAPDVANYEGSPWGRLGFSFLLPSALYGVIRIAPLRPREWRWILAAFAILGAYLGITALFEASERWALVFPRYIADPEVGIHFGRARGPNLNSASLGVYLTACILCGWILLGQLRDRRQQLVVLYSLPLMMAGVFVTYTRSTWLGLLASGFVVLTLQLPGRLRIPAITAAGIAGVVVAAATWSSIVGLEREGSAAESNHSVNQRKSFAYVSWQMFKDHPLLGVGFGRFYDRKLPYLSDRRQEVELESIRYLHHHNTFLSVLVETGIVGLAVFVAVLCAWGRYAWQLAADARASAWNRSAGLLMLGILTAYVCSAAFHDLTLVPSQQALLFLFAGMTTSLWRNVKSTPPDGHAVAKQLQSFESRLGLDRPFDGRLANA